MGPLCHTWLFFPSSSCSMRLLSPPLLAVKCLSCSLPGGGLGPPSLPPPGLTPFPSGSRHHPTSPSDTQTMLWKIHGIQWNLFYSYWARIKPLDKLELSDIFLGFHSPFDQWGQKWGGGGDVGGVCVCCWSTLGANERGGHMGFEGELEWECTAFIWSGA